MTKETLPMELTRPCKGSPKGVNVRGWCFPQIVDTDKGERLACKYCELFFDYMPSDYKPLGTRFTGAWPVRNNPGPGTFPQGPKASCSNDIKYAGDGPWGCASRHRRTPASWPKRKPPPPQKQNQ